MSGSTLLRRHYISVDNAVEHAGFGMAQLKYIIAAAIVFFTENQIAMSTVIFLPNIKCQWDLDRRHILILLLSCSVSGLVGTVIGGKVADKYGRRKPIIGSIFAIIFFNVLSLLQKDFYLYLALRNVAYLFVPFTRPSATCLSLEVTPRRWRYAVKTCMGISSKSAAAVVTFLSYKYMDTLKWRHVSFYLLLPSFIPLFIYAFFIPESPRYLFLVGREQEATAIMHDLHKINKGFPLDHPIKSRQDPYRGRLRDIFSPEFERTTYILTIVFFIKHIVMSTLHLVMPLLIKGAYCSSPKDVHEDRSLKCTGLAKHSLRSLMNGYSIGVGIVIVSMILSQMIGRKRSSTICILTSGIIAVSCTLCQGKDLLTFKITMLYAFHHGAISILTLFIQETYPTSVRATATSAFHAITHLVSLFGPFIAVYGVLGHEQEFFAGSGAVLVLAAVILSKIKHDSLNEPLAESAREFYKEDSDWDIELDYDMD